MRDQRIGGSFGVRLGKNGYLGAVSGFRDDLRDGFFRLIFRFREKTQFFGWF